MSGPDLELETCPFDDPPEGDTACDLTAADIFDRWDPDQPGRRGGEEPAAPPPTRRIWYDDLAISQRAAPTFLVDGLIPDEALGVLWGASESGKTFLAIAWALSIATGRACFDRDVIRQGPAVFVVGEGAAHFGRRISAWKLANGWPLDEPAGLHIHDGAIDLGNDAAVDRFIHDARTIGPRIAFIDTWARCTPGAEENSARETGLAIRNIDRIKSELRCTVVALHHANASGERERGSTALRGAADFMFSLALVNDLRILTPDKSKDFGLPDVINLELAEVSDAGSMVMRLAGSIGASVTPFEFAFLRALRDSFPDGGRTSEIEIASNLKPRTAFRVVARLVELRMVLKAGTIYRLTDYGRIVANRGRS